VTTICRHSSRAVAFLKAVVRPKFRGPTSASIAQSQVWLGLPAGRSTCRIAAARAPWWSVRDDLRAIWPKSRRRLLVTRWKSGEQPVVPLTSAFDTSSSSSSSSNFFIKKSCHAQLNYKDVVMIKNRKIKIWIKGT